MFFKHTAIDSHFGKVAHVGGDGKGKRAFVDSLNCEVVYVNSKRGICLSTDRGVITTYAALLFDPATYQIQTRIPLPGIPSRTRLSADGRMAAYTVFISGHSYSSVDFSTQTMLIDAEAGKPIANLEEFVVTRDGQAFKNADFNFWGVTFTRDGSEFFATLSTQGQHYLVRGTVATRKATVVRDNVECPSLSPDGTRVAYKKRMSPTGQPVWRLHVFDLATRRDIELPEDRSVDDQLEWLDDATLVYATPDSQSGSTATTDIWRVAADGKSKPTLFISKGYSPAAVH